MINIFGGIMRLRHVIAEGVVAAAKETVNLTDSPRRAPGRQQRRGRQSHSSPP